MPHSHRRSVRLSRAAINRILVVLVLVLAMASGCSAGPTPRPTGTAAVDGHVEETLHEHDPHHALRAVLVLQHGKSVYERY